MKLQLPSSCLHLRRCFSSIVHTTPPPPPPSGVANLTSTRRLIELSGQDAPKFLQGATTTNIPSTAINSSAYTTLLNAQGRVLFDVFIYPFSADSYYIECDATSVNSLISHIRKYKLRSKFETKIVDPEELSVWASWGTETPPGTEVAAFRDDRTPAFGLRHLVKDNMRLEAEGAKECPPETYKLRRILRGIPEGQSELLSAQSLPQESCIDYMGGIDFRKGCYVGQELTIRTHHTGVVRKRILPVQLYADAASAPDTLEYVPVPLAERVQAGAEIVKVGRRKGRPAGKWVTGLGNVGLALCRLEAMTGIVLTEGTETGWRAGDEFKIVKREDGDAGNGGEGEMPKVKAFVPDWHQINKSGGKRAPVSNTPGI